VLVHGMKLAAAGLALGIGASMLLRGVLAGLVYGVSAGDPATYFAATAGMFAIALLSCYLPARKASGVDPQVALRYE